MNDKGLSKKTIRGHLNNMYLYLNNFLNYYDVVTMEDGVVEVSGFLSDWFIRKCLWSSEASIKSTAASIKKFYKCMMELGHVSEEDYNFLVETIKREMPSYLDTLVEYDSGLFF